MMADVVDVDVPVVAGSVAASWFAKSAAAV